MGSNAGLEDGITETPSLTSDWIRFELHSNDPTHAALADEIAPSVRHVTAIDRDLLNGYSPGICSELQSHPASRYPERSADREPEGAAFSLCTLAAVA